MQFMLHSLLAYLVGGDELAAKRFASADTARIDYLDQEMVKDQLLDIIIEAAVDKKLVNSIDENRFQEILDLLAELKRRGEALEAEFGIVSSSTVH